VHPLRVIVLHGFGSPKLISLKFPRFFSTDRLLT
jgi:hypothetical protein